MRRVRLCIGALLLLACSEENDGVFSPPGHAFYSVTSYESKGNNHPTRTCYDSAVTRAAEFQLSTPAAATLSTLAPGFAAAVTLYADGTFEVNISGAAYYGAFSPDASRFTADRTDGICKARMVGVRYEGPRMCEVTTVEQEAAVVAATNELIKETAFPNIGGFFRGYQAEVSAALMVTAPGQYEWSNGGWRLTGGLADRLSFKFADGTVMTAVGTGLTAVTVESPAAWKIAISASSDLTYVTDVRFGDWRVSQKNELQPITCCFEPCGGSIVQTLEAEWSSPLGKLRFNPNTFRGEEWFELQMVMETAGARFAAEVTASASYLSNGTLAKQWTSDERRAYCPYAGRAMLQAFPNVPELLGLCGNLTTGIVGCIPPRVPL